MLTSTQRQGKTVFASAGNAHPRAVVSPMASFDAHQLRLLPPVSKGNASTLQ